MKTVGIIAEFNPFHKGHEYLLRTLKEETGADYAVIVMSGDYTQRGAPAILDKYTRTKMALMSGADLVFELPIYYSTSSAEFFAGGAVSVLNNLGCIDYLGFGSESADLDSMKKVARVLADEPEEFSARIKAYMKTGMNYAAARSNALSDSASADGTDNINLSLISTPNDILGTEYIKALFLQNSSIKPYAIKRVGASYDDMGISPDAEYFSSAKAIRNILENCDLSSEDFSGALSQFPSDIKNYLESSYPDGNLKIISADIFSELLHYKLINEKDYGFEKYLDVSPDLSDKITGKIPEYTSFSDFTALLKSKDLTYTRISRALLHILLGMTTEKMSLYSPDRSAFTSYARVLGFRKSASPLLKKIQECSRIPVISTLSDAYKTLDENAYSLLSETIAASNIYDLVRGISPINEYAKTPVIQPSCTDKHRD
ncbi:nucleotidyltransferase [Butyrivibrio sp. INlla16]|uniref:nucleotidyltransferase n=1 Tax=Butyrivibrio sp. INlla16 TaxID=1520807 RepID=UPI00088F1835|nr:nucleotidyltransferase [Butyrivibrio sp. INlla16]SDB49130.1 Predicted nucleotidyltransferase [Butyrivibrio sp. INlla16]